MNIKTRKKTILLLLITLVIMFIVIKDDFSQIFLTISKSKIYLIVFCLLLTIAYYSFKALSMYTISLKYKSKIKYRTFLKQTIITQFFNGITPFATGGQPMQVYMLLKEKMPLPLATSTVLMDFMAYQIAIIIYCFITLLLDIKLKIFSENQFARFLVLIGFAINLIVCAFASIICFSTKTTSFIMKKISKLLKRFHKEQLTEKISEKIKEFHNGTKTFIKDKKMFLKCILINILGLTFFYIISFFASLAIIGDNSLLSILVSIVASSYVFLVGAFIPIPGGSGGIEYGFMQFFGKFFERVDLLALLLIWRFITYYFGIVLGGILFSFRTNGGD